jgi:orotidine-5'-phosphate decarboxylase
MPPGLLHSIYFNTSNRKMLQAIQSAKDRIIVALDVPSLDEVKNVVGALSGRVGAFKVGLELITAEGSRAVVDAIHETGSRVFYDAKFNDIPNTVAGAAKSAAALGVWMFDVHASSGPQAIAAAVANKGSSYVVAVTVLTSLDDDRSLRIFGAPAGTKVLEFARMSADAGADGLVCSPHELPLLRADVALRSLWTIVPGVRPAWASSDDQARVMTPGEAVRSGATAVVIGRPILRPPATIGGPKDALARIVAEIEAALARDDAPTQGDGASA